MEQTCGGLTSNLWDDPFEWTLPETLTTKDKLIAYVDEVHYARQRAFRLFKDDADLLKTIMAASGLTQLMTLLLEALAEGYPNRGLAQQVHDAGLHAANLTNQLLTFSRKHMVRPRPTDRPGS